MVKEGGGSVGRRSTIIGLAKRKSWGHYKSSFQVGVGDIIY